MGVGKSTVAKEVAMYLKCPFIDLDAFIEYKEGKTISSIFEMEGEAKFRDLEYSQIQEILKKEDQVIALGGGSLSHHNLHQRIRKSALLIYLEADSPFLFERLNSDKEHRPLISHMENTDLKLFIDEQLFERESQYLNAQLRVNVQNKSTGEIVSLILEYLEMI